MTIAVYESYSWKGRPHGFRVLVGGVVDVVGHLVATGDSLTEGVGDPVDGIEMFGVGRIASIREVVRGSYLTPQLDVA